MSLNNSLAVFLMNPAVRGVLVTYEPDVMSGNTVARRADRVFYKTFDASIKPGDFVVVPTDSRWNLTVCKVEEVDVEADFDNMKSVEWIVGKVDRADYEDLKAQEASAIETIKAAEKTRKKKELAEKLLEHVEENKRAALMIAPSKPAAAPAPGDDD